MYVIIWETYWYYWHTSSCLLWPSFSTIRHINCQFHLKLNSKSRRCQKGQSYKYILHNMLVCIKRNSTVELSHCLPTRHTNFHYLRTLEKLTKFRHMQIALIQQNRKVKSYHLKKQIKWMEYWVTKIQMKACCLLWVLTEVPLNQLTTRSFSPYFRNSSWKPDHVRQSKEWNGTQPLFTALCIFTTAHLTCTGLLMDWHTKPSISMMTRNRISTSYTIFPI